MKKIIALILIILMSAILFGCQSKDDEPESTGTKVDTADTTDTTENTTMDSNELTVWCWDPAFNIYAMEEAEKIYKETHTDFILTIVETPWNDVQTKLTTAATSGQLDTLPDIILMQDNAFQKNYANFPEAFMDLTGTNIDFTQFAQSKVAFSVVDGKNFGVPFDNGTSIMALRKDIIGDAGYTVDDFKDITWNEYIRIGKVVLEKTGHPMLGTQAGSPDLINQMLQSAGGSMFDESGKPFIVGNKTLKEAMTVYQEMVVSGVLVEVNDWDQYIGTISNGTAAGTMNGCWILASIQATPDQSGKWGLTNVPKLDGIEGATNYTSNGGSSWLITSNTKNLDLAADFFATTFGGSVPFYETILPTSGALSTYLPAGKSDVYMQPSDFFGGQKIYADITEYAGHVPNSNPGVYYYEARDAIGVAITNVIAGSNLDDEIQAAQDTVVFTIGE